MEKKTNPNNTQTKCASPVPRRAREDGTSNPSQAVSQQDPCLGCLQKLSPLWRKQIR